MEVLASAMQKNSSVVVQHLRNIRFLDARNAREMEELRARENDLIQELQLAIKEGRTLDEEAMIEKQRAIDRERQICIERYDRQVAIAQMLYNQLDDHINYLSKSFFVVY